MGELEGRVCKLFYVQILDLLLDLLRTSLTGSLEGRSEQRC